MADAEADAQAPEASPAAALVVVIAPCPSEACADGRAALEVEAREVLVGAGSAGLIAGAPPVLADRAAAGFGQAAGHPKVDVVGLPRRALVVDEVQDVPVTPLAGGAIRGPIRRSTRAPADVLIEAVPRRALEVGLARGADLATRLRAGAGEDGCIRRAFGRGQGHARLPGHTLGARLANLGLRLAGVEDEHLVVEVVGRDGYGRAVAALAVRAIDAGREAGVSEEVAAHAQATRALEAVGAEVALAPLGQRRHTAELQPASHGERRAGLICRTVDVPCTGRRHALAGVRVADAVAAVVRVLSTPRAAGVIRRAVLIARAVGVRAAAAEVAVARADADHAVVRLGAAALVADAVDPAVLIGGTRRVPGADAGAARVVATLPGAAVIGVRAAAVHTLSITAAVLAHRARDVALAAAPMRGRVAIALVPAGVGIDAAADGAEALRGAELVQGAGLIVDAAAVAGRGVAHPVGRAVIRLDSAAGQARAVVAELARRATGVALAGAAVVERIADAVRAGVGIHPTAGAAETVGTVFTPRAANVRDAAASPGGPVAELFLGAAVRVEAAAPLANATVAELLRRAGLVAAAAADPAGELADGAGRAAADATADSAVTRLAVHLRRTAHVGHALEPGRPALMGGR